MRILLVLSVALIGLLADQSSLFATLVYRYELNHPGEGIIPQGNTNSGYIDMRYESGNMSPREAIYDFRVTSNSYPDFNIPAITYTFAESTLSQPEQAFISWDGKMLGGVWLFQSPILYDLQGNFLAQSHFSELSIMTFWPFNLPIDESGGTIFWQFTGRREVPEAGSTLLYLAIGMIVLSSAGIKGLAARKT
jgi:hypothetical protein